MHKIRYQWFLCILEDRRYLTESYKNMKYKIESDFDAVYYYTTLAMQFDSVINYHYCSNRSTIGHIFLWSVRRKIRTKGSSRSVMAVKIIGVGGTIADCHLSMLLDWGLWGFLNKLGYFKPRHINFLVCIKTFESWVLRREFLFIYYRSWWSCKVVMLCTEYM